LKAAVHKRPLLHAGRTTRKNMVKYRAKRYYETYINGNRFMMV
jgi:hypothetical protein